MYESSAPAALAETHISVVVFVGDRVYKLKKPVDLGFLDFSSRAARELACHREVELNRRLAPDVYLGVADVLGLDGETADHLVVMRRMPDDRRLATLVQRHDRTVPEALRELARVLADFHSRAASSPDIDEAASPAAVRANWEESFADLRGPIGAVLDADRRGRVEWLVERYLHGRSPLFEARVAGGHVCDGHGDLQAADVFCLDDGPRVLDCIEFNDRFRYGDVMADVAFLAMDLERLGSLDLAVMFLDWYREFAGETCAASLVDHYIAYRALVRSKVSCLRAGQVAGDAALEAAAEANRVLALAERHLLAARVRLILVGGLPGTGKSTVALGLGAAHAWTVLRSDEIRKELAGVAPTHRRGDAFLEGLYDPSTTEQVYSEMLRRAEQALRLGESVVLDASWTSDDQRRRARELADRCSADTTELRCVAPTHIAEERMLERMAWGGDPSDADPSIAAHLDEIADAWPESQVVDTSHSPAESLADAEEALVGLRPTVAIV